MGFPWEDIAFSKYLLDNPSKFKLIRVEDFKPGGCSPDETAQDGWITAKTSSDSTVLKIIESIYSVTEDLTMAKYVSENWDKHFTKRNLVTKKKHFDKFFADIPECDKLRTVSVLKALSSDIVAIASNHLDETFGQLSVIIKHPQRFNTIIKTSPNIKEKIRVVHIIESQSKNFTLNWQLIIDLEWIRGNLNTNINLIIMHINWKKSSGSGTSELEEAVLCRAASYSSFSEGFKSNSSNNNVSTKKPTPKLAVTTDDSFSTTGNGNGDSKKKSSSTNLTKSDDLTLKRLSSTDDDDVTNLEEVDDINFVQSSVVANSLSQFLSRSVPSYQGLELNLQCSNPSLIIGNAARVPGEFASVSMEDVDFESKYSTPLLLPGEVIQSTMPKIKHKYDIPSSSASDGSTGEKKSKWFGVSRSSTKKKATSQQAVDGCLLITTFQIIFVPVSI